MSQNSKGQKRSVPERKDDLDGDPVRPPKRQSFTIVFKKPVEDLDETESEPESEYEPEPEPRAIPPPVRKQRKQKQDPKKTRGLRTDPKEKSVAESNEDDEEDQSRISQGYAVRYPSNFLKTRLTNFRTHLRIDQSVYQAAELLTMESTIVNRPLLVKWTRPRWF